MKVLVTGAAGLLGSNFSRYLLEKEYEVIGVDNFFGGYKSFLPIHKNFYFFQLDLENQKDVEQLFTNEKPDVVFHFAAYAAEGLSPFIRNFNYRNNLLASINLINECIKKDIKIIFTSSMAVYGEQEPPFIETMIPKPVDPYGVAKYAVEMDLESGKQQFGLRYNIVRPHNVLGKYQNIWDRYRNVIGIFIRKTLNNEPILIYGDGNQTRAFSDIKFYMEPFEKLINGFDNEVFNIGADKYFSINEVANIVKKISNKYNFNPIITHVEPRHEVKHAFCDHKKAKQLLDFKDETNIESLIEDMFVWAMFEPNREVKFMNYEINKGLYEYWKIK
jgi:UDP-glucose 4-epimerase